MTKNKPTFLALGLWLSWTLAAPAAAQVCEIPVWVAADPAPNVLVAFDTSTSMRDFPDSTTPVYEGNPATGPDYRSLLEADLATMSVTRHPLARRMQRLHGSSTTAFEDFAIYDAAGNKICDRWNQGPCASELSRAAQCNLGRAVDDVDACAASDGHGCGGGTTYTPNNACTSPGADLAWGKGFAEAGWSASDGRDSDLDDFWGLDTLFQGRRLNYQRYHRAKDDIAKDALVGVVDTFRDYLSWGVMEFTPRITSSNPGDANLGGVLLEEISDADSVIDEILDYHGSVTLSSNLRSATAWTDDGPMVNCPGTPLAKQLRDVYAYFRGEFSNPGSSTVFDSPIQEACHESVVVIVTDGQPSVDYSESEVASRSIGGSTCSGYSDGDDSYALDDFAACVYEQGDLSDLLPGDQPLSVYTIGFGAGGGAAFDDLLQDTADNGGGLYVRADDAVELQQGFAQIANSIVNDRTASGTGAARFSGAGANLLISASFESGTWRGQLRGFQQPYTDGDAPLWDAGALLEVRDPATRNVYTVLDTGDGDGKIDNVVALTTANVATLAPFMDVGGDTTYATEVIEWVRGTDVAGYRTRDEDDDGQVWKLGDIVKSTPVVVGAPAFHYSDAAYQSFLVDQASRPAVIYVGTNDGGLRAIDAATGVERWFLVPNFNLSRLKDVADADYCHINTMNGTPRVVDAYVAVDGEVAQWRTILVIGGGGTGGYFAVDVTDPGTVAAPNPPKVLWQWPHPTVASQPEALSVPTLGVSSSTAAIGFKQSGAATWPATVTQWRAVISSGPENSDGEAYVYDVALESGQLQATIDLDPSASESDNWPTDVSLVDVSGDRQFDHFYVAARNGKIWRHAVGGSTQLLFDAQRPLSARPVASFTTTAGGDPDVLVVIGTGEIVERDDVETTDVERLYVLKDDVSHNTGSPGTAAEIPFGHLTDMTDRDASITDVPGRGWYVDLKLDANGEPGSANSASGVRVLRPAMLARGVLFQTVFDPTDVACQFGGDAYLLVFDLLTGNATKVPVLDRDGDGEVDSDDLSGGAVTRGMVLGDGIPERPVVDPVNGTLIIQLGDTTVELPALRLTTPPIPVGWQIVTGG